MKLFYHSLKQRFFLIFLFLGGFSFQTISAQVDLTEWNLLAIQDQGRRKPLHSFSREMLVRLHGKSIYRSADKNWKPEEIAFSLFFHTHAWEKEPLLLVNYRPLVKTLGLETDRKHFSFEELSQVPGLTERVVAVQLKKQKNETISREDHEVENIATRLTLLNQWQSGALFRLVPPLASSKAVWLTPWEMGSVYGVDAVDGVKKNIEQMEVAVRAGDGAQFNNNAKQLREKLRALNPLLYPSEKDLKFELLYNHLRVFDWAMMCYGIAFIFLFLARIKNRFGLQTLGIISAVIGIGLQCLGFVMRCLIAGRPPVTNMYESVVWVAFGTSLFGLIFLWRYRNSLYLLAALPVSFLCLLLVGRLPVAMPDRLDPLVPVLRDNFWLTVHVLTITLSYAAFALAMGFGHVVLFRYIRRPRETAQDATLHFWLYRIMQLGVLLLAAGTILGGVWANYSWGRFWGWDPKETWALIALLIYIFVIHGRIAGWWGSFGLAVGSVVCFSGVVMTWYGVNFILGKGLHSYGFGVGGESYVVMFLIGEALFVALACWRHQQTRAIKKKATT